MNIHTVCIYLIDGTVHFLLVQYLITFVMNLFKATPQIPTLHPLSAQQSEAITSDQLRKLRFSSKPKNRHLKKKISINLGIDLGFLSKLYVSM